MKTALKDSKRYSIAVVKKRLKTVIQRRGVHETKIF
ncbi:hypothetical protein E2C01_049887 [Portunus trituberculatus]|uniref:Uncharacterized protein n=1 Tax=Portunus trituberculatus TaxID=210409 RepID=A0A5B7GEF5_PORTR|nr:hypothetical protein [Portunus trituberculatus]